MYIKRKNHSGSLKAYTIEPLTKIISNIDFKPAVAPAKVPLQMLVSVHRMPLQMNTAQLFSSNGVSLMANKDDIILISYLHLQFRSVNCLKIRRPLKQLPKLTFPWRSQMQFFRNFFANQYQDIYGRVPLLRTQSGVEGKMRIRKVECDEIKFVQAYHTTNIFFEA